MNWNGKRVWVTGGSGVIGKELLARLSARGAIVRSTDVVPLDVELPGVQAEDGDLADMELYSIAQFDPQVIFHLAAAFERSVETPEFWGKNYKDNVVASHRVVEVARACRSLETFVFASSYLIYAPPLYYFDSPPAQPRALEEGDLVSPRNLCGAAKFYTERELAGLEAAGLTCRTVSARIYRVYGRNSRDIVSRWVDMALRGKTLEIYGRRNRFDYIHAGDVAEGCLRLAESPEAHGVVNLGSGQSRSVDELVRAIEAAVPGVQTRDVEVTGEPYEASQADLRRLREVTGWVPEVALEAGVRMLVDARREHLARTGGAEPALAGSSA